MKKALLFCFAALFSMLANAGDGIVVVGANITVLPASRYDGNVEWKAYTWVYNSGTRFGNHGTDNPNYCAELGTGGPSQDGNGHMWYEMDYNIADVLDYNYDKEIPGTDGEYEPIVWEEHSAPFSSDNKYNGRTSYQWTTGDIMADIFARRTFTTNNLLSGPVYLACGHDDAPCEYYINGELVYSRTGYETNEQGNIIQGWNNDEYVLLTDEQKALIKTNGEENLIAFHVHQNWGGAFADCGLYTKLEGGLDMGYQEPWEGKVLFNGRGGYNFDGKEPSNNPKHPWSKLYEAQEGDVYTFVIPGSADEENPDMEQLFFNSPIKIEEGHSYNFTAKLSSDKDFTAVVLKLGDNDDSEIELAYENYVIEAGQDTEISIDFEGEANNFMFAFDFGGGQDSATVSISEISLLDATDEKELWVGTHYFNYINMHKAKTTYFIWDDTLNDGSGDYREAKTEEEIENSDYDETEYFEVDAPEIEGRTETMAWTQADFDDSMWDDQMMPVCGSYDYFGINVQSIWPGGDNTNYWIRRNFELDKINERVEYQLNVCHDDVYETYVNGHLLQKNTHWTDGKNPVQVHIPARYLNVGKNVIATYIQQNWGGRFYDCGINVTEVDYNDCVKQFNDAMAYAQTDTLLTNKMKADIQVIIERARQFYKENINDAAELRAYARDSIRGNVNKIFAYSNSVLVLKQTLDICRTIEDKGYWGTALVDAAAALDTCATSGDLNPYLDKLRNARKATALERHNEKYVGCVPEIVSAEEIGDIMETNPKYYIYNVGAKLFLGGGESWGTHLALEYISNPMMLIQKMDENEEAIEGAFCVETFRANGAIGEADFMNWSGFIDTGVQSAWELIPVDGKTNVFNIAQYGQTHASAGKTYNGTEFEAGGKKLLGLRSGDNGYAPSYYVVDTDMHSPELETNQWMFVTREEMLSLLATASEDNPVDVSFLISNPDYDQRLTIEKWEHDNVGGNIGVWGRGGNNTNFVYEFFNTQSFSISQQLWPEEMDEALPAGTYVLSVQAYYRDGLEQAHVNKVLAEEGLEQRAKIYAGSINVDYTECESMPVMPINIEANQVPGIGWVSNPGNMRMPGQGDGCRQAAENYFPNGLYKNYLPFVLTAEDAGAIQIGIVKEADEAVTAGYGDWCVMDNWRLKYYGGGEIDPDAIKGIESDEIKKTSTASKGIYNLLGQKLTKTQRGVNIIGGKKIVKK